MIQGLPLSALLGYTIFSFFQFYQALHGKNFRGGSPAAGLLINLSAFVALIFSYGYLIYYGYSVAWYWPVIFFAVSLAAKTIWFVVEAKFKLNSFAEHIGLAAFVVLPVTGYLLATSIP